MGVSKNRGILPPKWMVKIMENPMNKWMIWGYHYFWKHPYPLKINSWKMKVPFEMVPFLGTSYFSGVYLHFLCCVVCVFCIQPLWPRFESSSCTMNHGAPQKCPFPLLFVRTKINTLNQQYHQNSHHTFVAVAVVATRQLILPSRGILFFWSFAQPWNSVLSLSAPGSDHGFEKKENRKTTNHGFSSSSRVRAKQPTSLRS